MGVPKVVESYRVESCFGCYPFEGLGDRLWMDRSTVGGGEDPALVLGSGCFQFGGLPSFPCRQYLEGLRSDIDGSP